MQTWTVTEPWVQPNCKLGEGPFDEEDTGKLRFLDIEKSQILWLDPSKGPSSLERVDVKDCVGFTADIESDSSKSIVGAKYGFAYMDKASGALEYITKPEDHWTRKDENPAAKAPGMRCNDGNVDPQGRFWCGMCCDPTVQKFSPIGALYCLNTDLTLRRVIDDVSIPNGIGWSPDGRTMYFTDSPQKSIVAYDFEPETGEISNKRMWYDAEEEGTGDYPVPDGFCQDEDGGFWVALFGGSKVVRLMDQEGKAVKVGEVHLPTTRITCPRLKDTTLWITSASEPEDAEDGQSKKFGGAVFAVDVGVRGKRMSKWKG